METSTGLDIATSSGVPFGAIVDIILGTLDRRDPAIAEHSYRVANLCLTVAPRLSIKSNELGFLEVAALLHDIGIMTIPDNLLKKRDQPLTNDEQRILYVHHCRGVDTVAAAFGARELIEIVRTYPAWYGAANAYPDLPSGDDIPLCARLLAVADAFDSMISDQPCHSKCTRSMAFIELRRQRGMRFDPIVADLFIETVSATSIISSTDNVVA